MEVCGKQIRVRGGLVRIASIDPEGYEFLPELAGALGAFRRLGTRLDLFTFIQKLSDTAPKYSFPMEWDNMAVLRVSTFDHWLKHQIDFKVRNKVRKAEKNSVKVQEVSLDEALVRSIHAIYNESPIRQGKRFWHYGRDIDTVRQMNTNFRERSIFIGATFNDDLIGFARLVANEDWSQAGLIQIMSMVRHRDKAPTNALIAQAVQSCADRGIPYLWYANFSYGKKQKDSLAEFKRHNGFEKVYVPRYYVPLTAIGKLALRFGLHHSINDWIPEPVAAAYRGIRRHWYTKRFAGLGENG
jgi:hypothetical protein